MNHHFSTARTNVTAKFGIRPAGGKSRHSWEFGHFRWAGGRRMAVGAAVFLSVLQFDN